MFIQDEEGIPEGLRNLPEYKELLELKRLKKQKLNEIQEDKTGVRHVGYKVKEARTPTTCRTHTCSGFALIQQQKLYVN